MECYHGTIWEKDPFDGYVVIDNNIVIEIGTGKPNMKCSEFKYILPPAIDSHTHVGDAGLNLNGKKYALEELVAPPSGLKHRYLETKSDDVIKKHMNAYCEKLCSSGVGKFIDFREGGKKGVQLLSNNNAVILGRPISKEFNAEEIESILENADGIGIPSISDVPLSYCEGIADVVHRKRKILALHASERIREDIDFILSLEPSFLVHMCKAEASDYKKCSDSNIPISVCTRSNLYFGIVPKIRTMEECGIDISIGTDNAMISSPSITDEMNAFTLISDAQGCSTDLPAYASVSAGKLLKMGTIIGLKEGDTVRTIAESSGSAIFIDKVPTSKSDKYAIQ